MSTVAIRNAARTWFVVAITGQTIFGVYIAAFYGGAAMRGHFESWNRGGSRHVWIPGDYTGNATFAIHMLSALVLTLGGIVQLIPQIRERAPAFHRWTGRVYMLTAFTASLAGLYLLGVLELYLRARDRGGRPARIAVATAIGALTLVTAVGVVGASLAMWIPHIR